MASFHELAKKVQQRKDLTSEQRKQFDKQKDMVEKPEFSVDKSQDRQLKNVFDKMGLNNSKNNSFSPEPIFYKTGKSYEQQKEYALNLRNPTPELRAG